LRPWLEIVRSETEKVYQNHQLKQLRLSHPGTLEYFWDVVPTDGFYDKQRLRLHSEELHRAYELMYPRDKKIVTPQIMDICGLYGITALWSDRGRMVGRKGKFMTRLGDSSNEAIADWLNRNGFPCTCFKHGNGSLVLSFSRETTSHLITSMRPYIHKTMRKTFVNKPPIQ
jgi:hypothetical protein